MRRPLKSLAATLAEQHEDMVNSMPAVPTAQRSSVPDARGPPGQASLPGGYLDHRWKLWRANHRPLPAQFRRRSVQASYARSYRYKDWAYYGEDSYKVSPKLTLNFGLRYEHYGVQHNNNQSLDSNFYFGSGYWA